MSSLDPSLGKNGAEIWTGCLILKEQMKTGAMLKMGNHIRHQLIIQIEMELNQRNLSQQKLNTRMEFQQARQLKNINSQMEISK